MTIEKILEQLAAILKQLQDYIYTQQPKPMPPTNNLVNMLALAIQRHEGWILSPPSRSVRNNNPGNTRYSRVGYLPKYGTVGKDFVGVKAGQQPFAVFKDYQTGFMYLKNLILEKARKHPEWNLVDFIGDEKEGWAPASDNNNVTAYANALGKALSVDPKIFKLRQLL